MMHYYLELLSCMLQVSIQNEYIDAIVENFGTPFDDHKKIQKIKMGNIKLTN